MLKNYLLVTYRNLLKNKIFSLVNILGLAIGMAACFFIFAYVHFESSYDRFHKNAADIYRVNTAFGGSFAGPTMATNHPATGPAMKKDFPEVKEFARLVTTSLFLPGSAISYTDSKGQTVDYNQEKIYLADPSFLTMFSFPFVKGDPTKALNEARSLVISQSMAAKYFGSADPIGKVLTLNRQLPLKVTGVFADVPENSHLKFDMLISFLTVGDKFGYDNWGWPEFYTYVQLAPGTDPKKVEAKFPAFTERYLGDIQRKLSFQTYFQLQSLANIHLRSDAVKGMEAGGSEKEIYFLTIIGGLILVIAWINYINLSTAKSVERAKEVGLRKVVGGRRWQIIGQFIMESVFVNLLALIVAVGVVVICFPFFGSFIGKDIDHGSASSGIWHAPSFWLATLSVYLVSAFLVGAYPAFVLSSFRPATVLKGKFAKSTKGIFLRKSLVVVQFVLSLLLIAGSVTVYLQLSFMRHQSLGYNKDQILVVKAPTFTDSTFGKRIGVFQAQLLQDPAIGGLAPSSDIPGKTVNGRNAIRKAIDDKTHNFETYISEVNDHFFQTYGMSLIAGRNLQPTDTMNAFRLRSGRYRVLVNEQTVKGIGFKSAEAAINQDIIFSYGTDEIPATIVGVVRNYHQRSLKEAYDPMLYLYPAYDNWSYFSIQVKADHLQQTLANIERSYKADFPGNPYQYFFLNEYFGRQYQADERFGRVFGLFTGLAIFVACLGLLGLSAFMIRLRTKETGVRKVLGASIYSLVLLFSKDFVKLVGVATLIAVPLVYFGATRWLSNYAFHIRPGVMIFAGPPVLLLAISLVMISVQSFKTAMGNPVKSLKSE